jgi:tetratricopeptide (TPR) repeat protein
MAAALDDWASVRREKMRDRVGALRLTEAARAADPDPWRNRLRDALDLPERHDRAEALRALARSAEIDKLPPVSLTLLGSALTEAGDPQTGEGILRAAQRLHPGEVELNYCLALCLEKLARRDEAIRYFTAAHSIKPATGHALAHALDAKGEWPEAIEIFRDLTRRRPMVGRHLMCLGTTLKKRGRAGEATSALNAAIAALRENIRQRPDDNWAQYNLGSALLRLGKFDAAVAAYREAIRLRPDEPMHYVGLASTLVEQGNVEAAMPLIREAMRLKPDYESHAALADALSKRGKLEEAIAEYRIANRLQPDSHASHESLADLLRREGKVEEALKEFRIASQIDPSCTYVRAGIADCLRRQGKLEEGIAACKEAIRIKPDDDGAHRALRILLKAQGKIDEVIADCREMIRLNPEDASNQNQVAWELTLLPGRSRVEYDEALLHARKAVKLAPEVGYIANTLALAEFRVGHWTECIAAAERSIALIQGVDASNWFFLAMARWQKGDTPEARTWFHKAVAWTKDNDPKNEELIQFWTEAAKLLGEPGPEPAAKESPAAPRVKKPR